MAAGCSAVMPSRPQIDRRGSAVDYRSGCAQVQGQLGDKLIAELIRDIDHKNASGLLRISQGKTIKAIFFEAGSPVFAISNLPSEQLDRQLVKQGAATPEQVEQARQRAGKTNRLGSALVEMGVLTAEQMRQIAREHVLGIIISLFEWTQGDYVFDERIRAAHEFKLDATAIDVILEGARHAARSLQAMEAILPEGAVVSRAKPAGGHRADAGKLLPVESYVLSRVETATAVGELGSLTGLSEEDAHRAVCALVSAGLLKLVEGGAGEQPDPEAEEALDRLREEVSRKIHFFTTADFYEVLGVTRHSTTGDIKTAYYQLARSFHPDKYRQPEHAELRGQLEALFSRVTQAYETLSDAAQRAAYDDRIRKSATGTLSEPATAEFIPPSEPRKPSDSERLALQTQPLVHPQAQAGDDARPQPEQQAKVANPALTAEHFYQQGRARYERKEYHAAVHLLREAIKLDPARAPYHFHLGLALICNPRTRREAEHHLSKAAELDPYNSVVRVKMGLLYKEVGLLKKADHYFQEALSLDPDNRVARRELEKQGKKGEAGPIWKAGVGSIAKRIFKK
jgi:tetratricopeptide (TPR) repeat protein